MADEVLKSLDPLEKEKQKKAKAIKQAIAKLHSNFIRYPRTMSKAMQVF
jgi:hypothetical protein